VNVLQPDLVLLGALASYLVYNLKSAFSPTASVLRIVWGSFHIYKKERCVAPSTMWRVSGRRFSLKANLVRATLAAEASTQA